MARKRASAVPRTPPALQRLEIKYVDPRALRPAERNPRRHNEEQLQRLMAIIVEFGWTIPILTDGTGAIIAGHARQLAAIRLELPEVPIVERTNLSAAQIRALVIADNQIVLLATWDADLLPLELAELREITDIRFTGFNEDEANAIFNPTAALKGPDEADTPAPPERTMVETGDVWLLGWHRLMCGNATNAEDVSTLFAGAEPNLMVTDPPYGVEYDAKWRKRVATNSPNLATKAVANDDQADWREAWALFPGSVAYVWHASEFTAVVLASLAATGFEHRAQIIWRKESLVISRGHYHWQHEPCWYAVRKGRQASWRGDRKQSTVWDIEHRKSETGHSTQKPVPCMQRPIANHTRANEVVYDPFSGSGTTIIASQNTGRCCVAMDIDPFCVDIAIRRWEQFTGDKAVRERDDAPYGPLEAESAPKAKKKSAHKRKTKRKAA